MRFVRLSDNSPVEAKPWRRHGDHPQVRPCRDTDPHGLGDARRCGWIDGVGVVLPGDWIVTDPDGRVLVLLERLFRKHYAPSADQSMSGQ